tara:strand:+ start:75 stop:626 length:552 start_codon:yes stop_codon:yes gene_type:complete
MIDKFLLQFVTLFGVGKIKKAPGTIASLITTLLFYLYFKTLSPYEFMEMKDDLLLFLFVFVIASYYAIEKVKNYFKSKDPKEIVLDEVCGQLIPLIMIVVIIGSPGTITKSSMQEYLLKFTMINKELYILISFISFRFFDIVKPFPVSYFDKKYKNSFGILFDDIVAGICAAVLIAIPLLIVT